MALRNYVLGEDSEFITTLYVHLAKEARDDWGSMQVTIDNHLDKAVGHSDTKLGEVKFFDVYRGPGDPIGDKARSAINRYLTVYPEEFLSRWQIDKLMVIHDESQSTGNQKERTRKRVAVIVLRARDYVFPNQDRVWRYRVTINDRYASNDNRYKVESVVDRLGDHDPIEVETQKVLAGN